jgi:hypothetical protein
MKPTTPLMSTAAAPLSRSTGATITLAQVRSKYRRQTLLDAGEIDPATVEEEYLDAKARYQAQLEACVAWDERSGLAALRKDYDRLLSAEYQFAWRLAETRPATPAGAAALIQYVLDDDLAPDDEHWHVTALRSAVAALNSMGV